MPPWGRPPGGRGGVGRSIEEVEDVYRFQELDSDDERNGVFLDPGYQKVSNGKQYFNPDDLYFNDMDLRAWESRIAAMDALGYGDDYGYQEDEGFYDEITGVTMPPEEYQELLFQRVLDKIRLARATSQPDVQLSQEELEVYECRLLGQRVPAVRPTPKARPVSMPVAVAVAGSTNNTLVNTSSHAGGSGSGSTKSKKSQRRTSIFTLRPKKDKPSGRKRSPSNVSETANQANQATQQPGFIVPGPSGQPVYAPINAYTGRTARDPAVRSSGSPSRRQAATPPPRLTPPREMPGGFPSGSPQRFPREPTPPRQTRQSSLQDSPDPLPSSRSRSSSIQQPAKLVPFPVTDYHYYTAEPLHYFSPGQLAPSQQHSPASSSSQPPQYTRRVGPGLADNAYMSMPRRVPVPVQRVAVPATGVQSSYSEPTLGCAGSGLQEEMNDRGDGAVLVDAIPQDDDKSHKTQNTKPSGKESSVSSRNARDSERRRRSGRSRRKP
ncbi:uncharacterized protein BDR25DRAFT_322827 [Lindgomyces ingoldianus]|uniref:Uncharacterized protein n=1 Tax=Lindgomyces ingoldianus TaxID=673940 RepID=A0ACB6R628_9PLEO|nr:uncharacterized protein BDR25DRAFT_322827 [Lindgomyces ingoldianus]KAF2474611.1 hypothetical protein BDR25DRAFT_322827 [Lindgomyces ingoldianus]